MAKPFLYGEPTVNIGRVVPESKLKHFQKIVDDELLKHVVNPVKPKKEVPAPPKPQSPRSRKETEQPKSIIKETIQRLNDGDKVSEDGVFVCGCSKYDGLFRRAKGCKLSPDEHNYDADQNFK